MGGLQRLFHGAGSGVCAHPLHPDIPGMCCHPPVPPSPEVSKRDKPINRDERLTACQGREEEEEEAFLENLTEKGKPLFSLQG